MFQLVGEWVGENCFQCEVDQCGVDYQIQLVVVYFLFQFQCWGDKVYDCDIKIIESDDVKVEKYNQFLKLVQWVMIY